MTITTLGMLKKNSICRIVGFSNQGYYKKQMLSFGLIPGTEVKMIRSSPLGDPVVYEVHGYHFCLRKNEANCISVEIMNK